MNRGRGVKDNDKDLFEGQRRTDTMILGNERRQSVEHRRGLHFVYAAELIISPQQSLREIMRCRIICHSVCMMEKHSLDVL